jgi:hypothetical protein
MIISDLSYLETVSESSVGGGDAQVSSYQLTYTNGEVTETTSGSPVLKEVLPDGSTRYFSTLGNSLVSITLSSGIMKLLQ